MSYALKSNAGNCAKIKEEEIAWYKRVALGSVAGAVAPSREAYKWARNTDASIARRALGVFGTVLSLPLGAVGGLVVGPAMGLMVNCDDYVGWGWDRKAKELKVEKEAKVKEKQHVDGELSDKVVEHNAHQEKQKLIHTAANIVEENVKKEEEDDKAITESSFDLSNVRRIFNSQPMKYPSYLAIKEMRNECHQYQ